MHIAFVLMNTEPLFMEEVLESLKDVESVMEAHSTYGIYDIIAKVEAETPDRLNEVVTQEIRKLSHVRSTLTMMVIEKMSDWNILA